jgi:redox-sensitive bicupin YhaK (pirin superfamily)
MRLFPAADRGLKDIGWLQSRFVFSFSSYRDPLKAGFGLLRVFNDDLVQPKGGFGIHPHENMEIISIMLAGRMNHKDTMGYSTEVKPGGVQIMSAGSGLRHEEWNIGDKEVRFLQIWIEPKLQNIPPRYQRRHFDPGSLPIGWTRLVSPEAGQGHCWINQDAYIDMGRIEAGHHWSESARSEAHASFLYVVEGNLEATGADGSLETLGPEDGLGCWGEEPIALKALEPLRLLRVQVPINH